MCEILIPWELSISSSVAVAGLREAKMLADKSEIQNSWFLSDTMHWGWSLLPAQLALLKEWRWWEVAF